MKANKNGVLSGKKSPKKVYFGGMWTWSLLNPKSNQSAWRRLFAWSSAPELDTLTHPFPFAHTQPLLHASFHYSINYFFFSFLLVYASRFFCDVMLLSWRGNDVMLTARSGPSEPLTWAWGPISIVMVICQHVGDWITVPLVGWLHAWWWGVKYTAWFPSTTSQQMAGVYWAIIKDFWISLYFFPFSELNHMMSWVE